VTKKAILLGPLCGVRKRIHNKRRDMGSRFIVVVTVLALSSVGIFGQTKSESKPLMGTWKLNVEKSKFSPGPGPKSQILTWKPSVTGFDFSVETVNAQGQPTHVMNGGSLDGKGYVVKTASRKMTRATKRSDDYTFEETDSIEGKVVTSRRAVISKDGKTLTITTKGTNAQGQPTSNVTVYEKQ
jgi:hypothetical protein